MFGRLLRRLPPRIRLELKRRIGRLNGAELTTLVLAESRGVIRAGPFAGMRYIDRASGSALAPKLLGSYECELQDVLRQIIATPHASIIDVGCAEGYYAVGLALHMHETTIYAFDIDPGALENLRQLSQLNGVQARVVVGGRLTPEELNEVGFGRRIVVCDIEGDERDLLDPDRAPLLSRHDVLVEIYDGAASSEIKDTFLARFGRSHHVRFIQARKRTGTELAGLEFLGHHRNRERAKNELPTSGLEWGFFESKVWHS